MSLKPIETLRNEISNILAESITPRLLAAVQNNLYSYSDDFAQLLCRFIACYANESFAKYAIVDALIPEIVLFQKVKNDIVIYISRTSLSKYLILESDYDVRQLKNDRKKIKFDKLLETKIENFEKSNFISNDKKRVKNIILQLLLVANHVAIHYKQILEDQSIDYDHESSADYVQFETLITKSSNYKIADYIEN